MPLCTITLLSLHTTTPNPLLAFLSTLHTTNLQPLVLSRIIRWIILPTSLSTSTLLAQNIHWDLLLILPTVTSLPPPIQKLVQHQWSIVAGIPSRIVQDFQSRNEKLLYPDPGTVPQLAAKLSKENTRMSDSSQNLELSPDLQSWIQTFYDHGGVSGRSAVSMLNLLSFKPDMKSSYLTYGAAFAESIGSKRGGDAKIVGTIVSENGVDKNGREDEWDEVAIAHYPTIRHFEEMLGSEDYQEVNKKFRVPALKDTLILCTSEIGIRELMSGKRRDSGKL